MHTCSTRAKDQEDSWNSLGGQSSQIGTLVCSKFRERPCLRKSNREWWRKTLWPLYTSTGMNAYQQICICRYVCVCTHTNMYIYIIHIHIHTSLPPPPSTNPRGWDSLDFCFIYTTLDPISIFLLFKSNCSIFQLLLKYNTQMQLFRNSSETHHCENNTHIPSGHPFPMSCTHVYLLHNGIRSTEMSNCPAIDKASQARSVPWKWSLR